MPEPDAIPIPGVSTPVLLNGGAPAVAAFAPVTLARWTAASATTAHAPRADTRRARGYTRSRNPRRACPAHRPGLRGPSRQPVRILDRRTRFLASTTPPGQYPSDSPEEQRRSRAAAE